MKQISMSKFVLRRIFLTSVVAVGISSCHPPDSDFIPAINKVIRDCHHSDPKISEKAYLNAIRICQEYQSRGGKLDYDYYSGVFYSKYAVFLLSESRLEESDMQMNKAVKHFMASSTAPELTDKAKVKNFHEHMGWTKDGKRVTRILPETK